jgi:predicted anti-sigma-YlaC factor YlaD
MDCKECREVLSARLDGRAAQQEMAAADHHLRGCAACSTFAADVERLHRAARLAAAPPVPDLTGSILARIGAETRPAGPDWATPVRLLLAAVALLEIAVALPALLLGDDAGLSAHAARHAGSFALAIGVGFLYVAWRPQRAAGVFIISAALMGCLVLASVLDVATGRAAMLSEAQHLPEVAGVLAVWMLRSEMETERRVGLA